ncbi:PQQ-dependent sugar dehydrogenase [Pseudoxanthomonas kaohsiungensis]|uniref:PQQ-dependent sugar dehydrogenase n=1 Tax=Pseudoxanthomonas kaohsiungensis TaxID=283923 RepID=A0ABW3LVN3_9GAMM|nr:PQQ-dependent sugar dehydrogenase [Pseudoxanthomonas kaohsiungensis]KAF1704475.1 glucose dehydrogenase [Pseudoxanthomonas kaohsiungensis]
MRRSPLSLLASALLVASAVASAQAPAAADRPFEAVEVARFDEPWAMTFLPDGRLLVTEKAGRLWVQDVATGKRTRIGRVPEVVHAGQGGFADVVLHPQFSSNGWVYLSYAEAGDGNTSGAAVARAKLDLEDKELEDLQVVWRQVPKVAGNGHYGHRIAFDADGMLWITSSERQKFDPAQDMASNLGKIVRLRDDGSVPDGNPFTGQGDVAAQVWSLGHRNMLGIDFDRDGRLWVHEMGPKGGDELNLIEKGANYGYPIVSNGDHYDGRPIPDHDTQPQYRAPVITWTPVISPAGFVIYDGDRYPGWNGSGLIGGLSSQSLVRVAFDGTSAREAERFDMGTRIREVEQGPDGTIWLLEDGGKGAQGRLYRLDPRS